MPDLDHLPRALGRGWRQVADAVTGHHDRVTVAERMEKAMAAVLRRGAAEHLRELESALRAAPADRLATVDLVVATLPRRWVTGVGSCFIHAARLLARGVGQSNGIGAEVGPTELATNGLRRMAWQQCLGPTELRAIPGSFASFEEYHGYVKGCLDSVRFARLAHAVARHDDPTAIRAPNTRNPRKSTRELLNVRI